MMTVDEAMAIAEEVSPVPARAAEALTVLRAEVWLRWEQRTALSFRLQDLRSVLARAGLDEQSDLYIALHDVSATAEAWMHPGTLTDATESHIRALETQAKAWWRGHPDELRELVISHYTAPQPQLNSEHALLASLLDDLNNLHEELLDRSSNHLGSAEPGDEDDINLHNVMAGAVGGCAAQVGSILRKARAAIASDQGSMHPDDIAVDRFAIAMKVKLAEARAKGRGGALTEPNLQQRLSDMLHEHVAKGDPVDVANFAMFLHQRDESIQPANTASRKIAWPEEYTAEDVPAGWDGLSAYQNGWNAAIRVCSAAAVPRASEYPVPSQECFSDDDGDSWFDHPADVEFVQGLALGEEFELSVSHYSVRRKYLVTKVPDDASDDYEVEPVIAAAPKETVDG